MRSAFTLTPMQAISLTTQRQLALMLRDKVLLKGRIRQVRVGGQWGGGEGWCECVEARRSASISPAMKIMPSLAEELYKCGSVG